MSFQNSGPAPAVKSLLVLLGLTLALAAGAPAYAQQAAGGAAANGSRVGRHTIGFGIGQTVLMGDFANNMDDGIGWQFLYEYQASDLFGLYLPIFHTSLSNSSDTNTLSMWTVTPNLKANLAYIDHLILFIYTGFGLVKASETLQSTSASVTTVQYDLGGGFDLDLSDHFIFGTTFAFNNIFGATDSSSVSGAYPNGISVGGTYLTMMLNVKYRF